MAKKKGNQQNVGTPYDDAFRSMYTRCKRLVLFLLNEMFDTNYAGDENMRFLPNETFLWRDNIKKAQKRAKRISDSQFEVTGHDGKVRRFQIECQSKADKNMSWRLMEYSMSFALDSADISNEKVRTQIHNTAVLYLRSNDNTPTRHEMEIVAPNGQSICWSAPAVKVSNYTLDELFAKKLYFLLPFHIFVFEDQLEKMETDAKERSVLTSMLEYMKRSILELEQNGELSSNDTDSILDNCWDVAKNVVRKFKAVRKEVRNIMGGRDYRTRSQVAYDKGIQLGLEKGEFGIVLDAINDGLFSLDYLEKKKKWSKAKIRRFLQFKNEQANAVLN